MKSHISTPAPRLLLRFIQLLLAIRQQGLIHSMQPMRCQSGPGLGNATSLTLAYFDVNEALLYEEADAARQLLCKRFSDNIKVHIRGSFSRKQNIDDQTRHYPRYERSELIEKPQASGFEDIKIYCYCFPLINILYPLRKLYYGSLLKARKFSEKTTATSKSGISRGYARSFNTTFVITIVWLFSPLQPLPILSRFGDGFVFTCRKA